MNHHYFTDRDSPPVPVAEETDSVLKLDIRSIWASMKRNRWIIFGIVAISIVAAIGVTFAMRPKYQAAATIQIDQSTAKVLETEDTPLQMASDDRFLQTQIDILKSRTLAMRVVNSLGLANDDSFAMKMGRKPIPESLKGDGAVKARTARAVGLLMSNLSIDLPRNSRIVAISFTSGNGELAARIANSYANNFILANLQRRYDTSAYARTFLESRLGLTRQKLQDSERAAIDYARAARLIDTSGANNSPEGTTATGTGSVPMSQLVQVSGALTEAQTQRIAAEQRYKQANRTPLLTLSDVLGNPVIQPLMQERAVLAASYEEERQRRKADYPTMLQKAAQIAELDRQINTLARGIKKTIYSNFLTAVGQEQALAKDVGSLQTATLNEQDRSIRYNILRREVDTNRVLYDGLLQRYKEVSAEAGIATNNVSIIDLAEAPTVPVSPVPLLNIGIAIIIGAALASVAVLARETFDDAIRSPEDVPTKLHLAVLGVIPTVAPGATSIEALQSPRSPISEAYQALRVALDLSTSSGVPKTLLITSTRTSEGKTTCAYAAARDFGRIGRKVLLIDCDLRRPALHRTMGLPNTVGLTSILSGHRAASDAVQKTVNLNVDFLSTGPQPPNPADLLASPVLRSLVESFSAHYDLIIIDGPPVLGLADAAQLSSMVEGTVFVIEAGSLHRGSAKASIRRLIGSHARLLGVVLTKFDAKKAGYGYGYGYEYSYNYGSNSLPPS